MFRPSLTWRPKLDGCIELAPEGQQYTIDQIVVTCPNEAFGWLHSAFAAPIVLSESSCRSAQVCDWPWPLRRALQSHREPESYYRQTMGAALMARFRQTPLLRQRLLALRYPVQVKGVPDGLIEEIAQALRRETD